MMDEQSIAYLVFSMIVPLMAFSFLPSLGSGFFGIIAIAVILLGIAAILIMNWADFVLFSLITEIFGITFQPAAGYKIVRAQDAVVKDFNGLFYATGFLTSNLFPYVFKQEETE